ncbi:hypothetical protein OS493_016142 [Desmophyllum pertusum]|uniref:Uncharacterized protein n=1 Tax=Desmophyllum pertusum TaxID=174260 RepID=A0A9X0A1P2_9CNID|nr:hypothetical protein OS493_016142 [Desmophyllum pertusum]
MLHGVHTAKRSNPSFLKWQRQSTEKKVPGGLGAVDCTVDKDLCAEQEVKVIPHVSTDVTSCHAQISIVTRDNT